MTLHNISTHFRNMAVASTSLLAMQNSTQNSLLSSTTKSQYSMKTWNHSATYRNEDINLLYSSLGPGTVPISTSQVLFNGSSLTQTTTHIFIVILAFLVIVALVANFILIAIIGSVKKLHSKTHLLIIDLAISDIVLALTVVPIDINRLVNNGFYHSVTTCEFVSTMFFMSLPASALSLSLLTLERYITLKYPLTHLQILTKKRAVCALALKWFYVIIIASLPALGWVDHPSSVDYRCNFFFTMEYAIFMVAANFVLPLLVILLANIEILRIANRAAVKIRQSMRRAERRRASLIAVGANVKAAKRIMLLVGLFLLSWLPYIGNTIYNISCNGCSSKVWSWITLTLNYSNASMNPILYGFLNKDVRHEIRKLLGQLSAKCRNNAFDNSFHGDVKTECIYSMSIATDKEIVNIKENVNETLL